MARHPGAGFEVSTPFAWGRRRLNSRALRKE